MRKRRRAPAQTKSLPCFRAVTRSSQTLQTPRFRIPTPFRTCAWSRAHCAGSFGRCAGSLAPGATSVHSVFMAKMVDTRTIASYIRSPVGARGIRSLCLHGGVSYGTYGSQGSGALDEPRRQVPSHAEHPARNHVADGRPRLLAEGARPGLRVVPRLPWASSVPTAPSPTLRPSPTSSVKRSSRSTPSMRAPSAARTPPSRALIRSTASRCSGTGLKPAQGFESISTVTQFVDTYAGWRNSRNAGDQGRCEAPRGTAASSMPTRRRSCAR